MITIRGYTGQVARQQAAALPADGVDLLSQYQDQLLPGLHSRRRHGQTGGLFSERAFDFKRLRYVTLSV